MPVEVLSSASIGEAHFTPCSTLVAAVARVHKIGPHVSPLAHRFGIISVHLGHLLLQM
jgi:hypothetical protein